MIALRLAFYLLVALAASGVVAHLILMARDQEGDRDARTDH